MLPESKGRSSSRVEELPIIWPHGTLHLLSWCPGDNETFHLEFNCSHQVVSVRQSVPDEDSAQHTLGDEDSKGLNPGFMQWKPLREHLVGFKEDVL